MAGRVGRRPGERCPAHGQPDQQVEHRDDRHRSEEEEEGGCLEGEAQISLGQDVTGDGLEQRPIAGVGHVHETELDDHRDGAGASDEPHADDHLQRPRQARHRLGAHRVTDGDVALDREGGDGEDGGVGRRLGRHRA